MPQRWSLLRRGWTLLTLAAVACDPKGADEAEETAAGGAGGEEGTGGTGGAGGSSDDPNEGRLFGTISLQMMEETETRSAVSVASGRLYNRLPLPTPRLREAETEGPCALWVMDMPICSGGCETGKLCVDDGVCQPYPEAQDAGPLWLTGLSQERVLIEAPPPSFIYQSPELPYPACDPGDRLALLGESLQAENHCTEPLRVGWSPIPVERDAPVALEWEAPSEPDEASIRITLDVAHHGGKTGEIVCEVPDVGSFEIPASLVTSLIDLGLAGFPSVFLTRTRSSPTNISGVTFEIFSAVERPVETGVISCLSDDDCPDGKTCDRERVICSP